MPSLKPVIGYSKGSRGLSVLVRVCGIFTTTTISPSPSLRQCGGRYTIRAGRKLPDKEFRYLRTVIVTAALHWRFGSELLTPCLNVPAAGRCQSLYVVCMTLQRPVFLVNSRPHRVPVTTWAPLLANLRGYFAEFLNDGSLERLRIFASPTCVSLGTVTHVLPNEVFLGHTSRKFPLRVLPARTSHRRIYLPASPRQEPESNNRIPFHMPSPHGANARWWCRNVDLLPIDYAFRPRLRSRLTLGGIAFPRKPSAYGERDSHPFSRYSSRHNH
jgi:hypothetical protein